MLKVALVQFAPLEPSIPTSPTTTAIPQPPRSATWQTNLDRAHGFVREAATGGADLVCFPEYFISGIVDHPGSWSLAQTPHAHSHLRRRPSSSSSPTADRQAVSTSHLSAVHWLDSFRSLAKELRVDIVVGTIVERAVDDKGEEKWKEIEIEGEDGGKRVERRPVLENVAHYIDWNGEIIGRYVKRNLWWPEKEYLTAGEEDHQVFETRFGRVGLLICWDLASPLSLPSLLLHPSGPPDLIIVPTYWTALDAGERGLKWNKNSEKEYVESLVKTRAWEGECALIFVNAGAPSTCSEGESTGNEHARIGSSAVCVPFKGKIGGAVSLAFFPMSGFALSPTSGSKQGESYNHYKGPQEELVLVDLDLSILEDARAVYGVRRDLYSKLEHPETRREQVLPGEDNSIHVVLPTLDVDLAWHGHQLQSVYAPGMVACVGRVVDHDNEVEENAFEMGLDVTAVVWQARFDVPYTTCGCHLLQLPPLARLDTKLHLRPSPSSTYSTTALTTLSASLDDADATHASEHNSYGIVGGGYICMS
ncbi:hypothetical protein JCM11641_007233 [Rhodosporidiobolus odoratus]